MTVIWGINAKRFMAPAKFYTIPYLRVSFSCPLASSIVETACQCKANMEITSYI
jgi:hypothetical protein